MPKKRITLQQWVALNYDAAGAPTMDTVRTWARDGKIQPQPQKQGREYYCDPDAVYDDGSAPGLVQRIKERMRGRTTPHLA